MRTRRQNTFSKIFFGIGCSAVLLVMMLAGSQLGQDVPTSEIAIHTPAVSLASGAR